MAKFFSAFIYIYIIYGKDPAQLLQSEAGEASQKTVFRFAGSHTKTSFHFMLTK